MEKTFTIEQMKIALNIIQDYQNQLDAAHQLIDALNKKIEELECQGDTKN